MVCDETLTSPTTHVWVSAFVFVAWMCRLDLKK